MHKCIMAGLVFSLAFHPTCMRKNSIPGNFRKQVLEDLNLPGAHFGVAFKDLQTGETLLLNEKDNFHAASTMKTPVLVELFKQASNGIFSMDDSILVKNSFSSIVDGSEYTLSPADDSEPELYKQIGQKKTINALAYDMIIHSSNLATNLLVELVKPERIMETMKVLGANDIRVLRGVEDGKAFAKGLNNSTTAYDLLLIFEKMAQEKLVNPGASLEMIRILQDQKFNDIIPANLPSSAKVAHKTGFITGIRHDSGIVFLPDGRKYVLVLLSRFEGVEDKEVIMAMAKASRTIYDHMMQ